MEIPVLSLGDIVFTEDNHVRSTTNVSLHSQVVVILSRNSQWGHLEMRWGGILGHHGDEAAAAGRYLLTAGDVKSPAQ